MREGDEEQATGGENDVLWAVGEASDDEGEDEDEDVDHHQHPLHQDLPNGRIAGAVGGSQRRSSRRGVNERTGLVSPADEDENRDYMEGSRMMDANRRRSMDPFRDDEHLEMHDVAGEIRLQR